MNFDSLTYALFLPAVFLIYYLPTMTGNARRQNALILAASYLFYGAWDWRFLSLIIFTTLSTWGCALLMERRRHDARLLCGANIAVNLLILALFKYFNFFGENLARLFDLMGWSFDWVFLDILLPVGISFYTFQAIGYTVDVYRRDCRAVRSPLLFATFIAYFPQLVAGPIERASQLMPQLSAPRRWDSRDATEGLRRVLWGLVKKVAVADQCSFYVDRFWADGLDTPHGHIRVFLAALLFTVQIYCDFSGYCDIAVGSSRMLGIRLMENFRRPYFSRSVLEFWHRWHVSLMKWFTSYVYIPLGGSRVSAGRTYLNVAVVFLLSGLWHGASWCFVLWGAYWAAVYIAARVMRVSAYKDGPVPAADFQTCMRIAVTMALVIIGWGIFRSRSLGQCAAYLAGSIVPLTAITTVAAVAAIRLLCLLPRGRYVHSIVAVVIASAAVASLIYAPGWFFVPVAAAVIGCEWLTRADDRRMFPLPRRRALRIGLYMLLFLIILTAPDVGAQFIYFQF